MTAVLVHGSWHTGEAWESVQELLEASGVSVFAPTLSGMESMDRPGGPDVDLETHIDDIVDLITDNALRDVMLVAHSYSGFVVTGVADRVPDRVARLIFIDAFIPEPNQSLFDILGAESEAGMRAGLVDDGGRTKGEGASDVWLLPPADPAFYLGEDATDEQVAWLSERLVYKPVATFTQRLRLTDVAAVRAIPSSFIRCTRFPYMETEAEKARALGWPMFEIHTGHDAMVTEPQAVADLLLEISK